MDLAGVSLGTPVPILLQMTGHLLLPYQQGGGISGASVDLFGLLVLCDSGRLRWAWRAITWKEFELSGNYVVVIVQ